MENLSYSEILKQNNLLAGEVSRNAPYRINILSNVICTQLKNILEFNLRKAGLNPEIHIANFDNAVQESYECKDYNLVVVHCDLVAIVDKCSEFVEDLSADKIDILVRDINREIDIILGNLVAVPLVALSTFSSSGIYANALTRSKVGQLVGGLNEHLFSIHQVNLNLLDLTALITKIGSSNSYDYRMYCISKSLYTIGFWKEYVFALSNIVYKNTGRLRKAIIFDCDDTLWKGILGEDGFSGIDMSPHSSVGRVFHRVQQIAAWLSRNGVILGLCSKNNPEDVEKVLSEHPDIYLNKEHIVISKINWSDKATNLKEIARELNIGSDSIVFVDDSPFEISLVQKQIPEMMTLQVPKSIHQYPSALLNLVERYFQLSNSEFDVERTKQYQARELHNEARGKSGSLEDYLSSIETEIAISANDVMQVPRISQLTQKTNQFNLTTIRYTENEIQAFMNEASTQIYSIFVKDRFGENGLTAVCISRELKTVSTIDSFLLSCRVIGRHVERAIMNFFVDRCREHGIEVIESSYSPTIKNQQVKEFFDDCGFSVIFEDDGFKKYRLIVSEYKPWDVDYIKIEYQNG